MALQKEVATRPRGRKQLSLRHRRGPKRRKVSAPAAAEAEGAVVVPIPSFSAFRQSRAFAEAQAAAEEQGAALAPFAAARTEFVKQEKRKRSLKTLSLLRRRSATRREGSASAAPEAEGVGGVPFCQSLSEAVAATQAAAEEYGVAPTPLAAVRTEVGKDEKRKRSHKSSQKARKRGRKKLKVSDSDTSDNITAPALGASQGNSGSSIGALEVDIRNESFPRVVGKARKTNDKLASLIPGDSISVSSHDEEPIHFRGNGIKTGNACYYKLGAEEQAHTDGEDILGQNDVVSSELGGRESYDNSEDDLMEKPKSKQSCIESEGVGARETNSISSAAGYASAGAVMDDKHSKRPVTDNEGKVTVRVDTEPLGDTKSTVKARQPGRLALLRAVDHIFLMTESDKDSVTIGDVLRLLQSYFGVEKFRRSNKMIIRARLTDLITGKVEPEWDEGEGGDQEMRKEERESEGDEGEEEAEGSPAFKALFPGSPVFKSLVRPAACQDHARSPPTATRNQVGSSLIDSSRPGNSASGGQGIAEGRDKEDDDDGDGEATSGNTERDVLRGETVSRTGKCKRRKDEVEALQPKVSRSGCIRQTTTASVSVAEGANRSTEDGMINQKDEGTVASTKEERVDIENIAGNHGSRKAAVDSPLPAHSRARNEGLREKETSAAGVPASIRPADAAEEEAARSAGMISCPICSEGYAHDHSSSCSGGGEKDRRPVSFPCCGNTVCANCAETHRAAKIAELAGRRKMIRCMMCNEKFHCEKTKFALSNNHVDFLRLLKSRAGRSGNAVDVEHGAGQYVAGHGSTTEHQEQSADEVENDRGSSAVSETEARNANEDGRIAVDQGRKAVGEGQASSSIQHASLQVADPCLDESQPSSIRRWLRDVDTHYSLNARMESRYASAFEAEFACLAFLSLAYRQGKEEHIFSACGVNTVGDKACLRWAMDKLPCLS